MIRKIPALLLEEVVCASPVVHVIAKFPCSGFYDLKVILCFLAVPVMTCVTIRRV